MIDYQLTPLMASRCQHFLERRYKMTTKEAVGNLLDTVREVY